MTPALHQEAPASTLRDVEAAFAKWICDVDPIPTRATLAAYLANRKLTGDPVWLMLVGGSGVGKTERLSALADMPDVILESSITGPAALLSGTGRKDRAKDATGGLLMKLPQRSDGSSEGVLLLKDFTSILEMHRDPRGEVLGAFREIYDGQWSRSIGAEGGRTLTWRGRLGVLAGCTTAIDSAHAVISQMGTRFLMVRLTAGDSLAQAALDHVGREHQMRSELREAAGALLACPPGQLFSIDSVRDSLAALGSYVALARSPVDRDQQGEVRLVLDPEAPTRIVKMLAQLWRAAGLLGLDEANGWEMVRRVGLDSIPKLRRVVLHYLEASIVPQSTTDISEAVDQAFACSQEPSSDFPLENVVPSAAGWFGMWLRRRSSSLSVFGQPKRLSAVSTTTAGKAVAALAGIPAQTGTSRFSAPRSTGA